MYKEEDEAISIHNIPPPPHYVNKDNHEDK